MSGVPASSIGLVSPYRAQVQLLRSSLSLKGIQDVEAETVDRYQGRDKDVILVSFVRSNKDGQIGDLLRDWRRVNVVLTRAKRKLIIIGSSSTLGSHGKLGALIQFTRETQWLYKLPTDSLSSHGKNLDFRMSENPELQQIQLDGANRMSRVMRHHSILRDVILDAGMEGGK